MKPNRRRFLSLLGVGTAAGPLAAKAAAESQIADMMNIKAIGAFGGVGAGLPGQPAEQSGGNVPYAKRMIGASEYVKMFGVPQVIDEGLRQNSRWINGLDCDIACKKSWSMSVKVMTQRQRNYEKILESLHKMGWRQKSLDALKSVMGFEWPW